VVRAALFSFLRSRRSAHIGAERKHTFADDGDYCILAIDARDRMQYLRKKTKCLLTTMKSIYSMNALPKSAGIASYVVVTILMCAITYVLVLNLRHLKEAVSWGRSSVRNILHTQKMEGQEKWTKRHKMSRSDAERTSTMA